MSDIDEALEALELIWGEINRTPHTPDSPPWETLVDAHKEVRQALERQRVPLTWGEHERDGELHTEWHASCGCAYHPEPFPHVHPCSGEHTAERQRVSDVLATSKLVDEYADEYTLEGDDGYYNPTERERFLLRDFGHGLVDGLRQLAAAPEPEDSNE